MRHPAAMKPFTTLGAAMALLVVASCGGTQAAPPVAPSPEPLVADSAVVAVAHGELDHGATTDRGVPLGPVPLRPTGTATASPTGDPRPMPDWRLLIALGGAFAAIAAYRFVGQRRPAALPPDVFELLGEAPLGGQQSVRVVRFGPRTLLVGVSSAGLRTLAEVTDPQATERIVSACHAADGGRGPVRAARRPTAGRRVTEPPS